MTPVTYPRNIVISFCGKSVRGQIAFASADALSLILFLDGSLGRYSVLMPVLWLQEEDGYVDLMERKRVQIYEYRYLHGELMKCVQLVFIVAACFFFLAPFWFLIHPPVANADLVRGFAFQTLTPHTPSSSTDTQPFTTEEAVLPSGSVTFHNQKPTRTHVIRVVDSTSKDPISHAKMWVEIGDLPEKRNGYTDARGAFMFTWQVTKAHIKTHIAVEAAGYATIEDVGVLTEEWLIQLSKTK